MTHTHPLTDELYVYSVPADTDQKGELLCIPNKFDKMQNLVGGYIEVVRTPFIPELPCGCPMVMVVNEEGHLRGLDHNMRASTFYPGKPGIAGDVFLVAEGMVSSAGGPEPDFFSLPTNFHEWEGPGAPIPTVKQPWEE